MRRSRWLPVLVIGGCSFSAPIEVMWDASGDPGGDAGPADAPPPIDGSIDADPSLCFGAGEYTVCVPTLPAEELMLGTQTIMTDPGACPGTIHIPGAGRPWLCVLAGDNVTVTGRFEARGSLPLVLLATAGDVRVNANATVDVSSRAGVTGAGANFSGCISASPAASSTAGGGGGAGGSFGNSGGSGGDNSSAPGGNPAIATGASFLRGGCRGGRGGNGNNGNGGEAGNGGGAVYLIASGTVIVDGNVNASGEAGGGGQASKGGGGGGGSGGMIALYGSSLAINGQLWANGGGGGGGAGNSSGARGGESQAPGQAGSEGIGDAGEGTNGGQGGVGSNAGGSANNASKGAGGAGGGVGVLRSVSGQPVGGTHSPDPS